MKKMKISKSVPSVVEKNLNEKNRLGSQGCHLSIQDNLWMSYRFMNRHKCSWDQNLITGKSNFWRLWKESILCWPVLTLLHPSWGKMNLIFSEKNLIEKNRLGSQGCNVSIQFEWWRFWELISRIKCYWVGKEHFT